MPHLRCSPTTAAVSLLAASAALPAQQSPTAPARDSLHAAAWRVALRPVPPGAPLRITAGAAGGLGGTDRRLVTRLARAGDSALVLATPGAAPGDTLALPWRDVRRIDLGVRGYAERMTLLGAAGAAVGLAVGRQFGRSCAPNAFLCVLPEREVNGLLGGVAGAVAGALVGRYAVRPVTRWLALRPGRPGVRRLGVLCPLAFRLARQCI